MLAVDRRHQDTYDLRDQILPDDHNSHIMDHAYPSDEEHSVLEDDSDNEGHDGDYMDDEDDDSSSLSIPNEAIDFDLVYALHSFAATVDGQANVVKGDSLFLMDDSNSYWWLVRVLKTQEVGYIPAENIETPFERLARLNKHRNVDLASATQAEQIEADSRLRARMEQNTPSPTPDRARSQQGRGVVFTATLSVHRYPPAVWGDDEGDEEDEDVEWDDEGYEDEDPELAEEQEARERAMLVESRGVKTLPVTSGAGSSPGAMALSMEPDDGMSWEDGAVEEMQRPKQQAEAAEAERVRQLQEQEQEQLIAQQQMQQQQQQLLEQQQREQQQREQQAQMRRKQELEMADVAAGAPAKVLDPAQATSTRKISMTPAVARMDETRPSTIQQQQQQQPQGVLVQRMSDERKRSREDAEAEEARKRSNISGSVAKGAPVSSVGANGRPVAGAKLRKEREPMGDEDGGKDKKKKGGVFGIFKRNKDKDKGRDKGVDSSSVASGSSDRDYSRESEESGKSSIKDAHGLSSSPGEPASPITSMARQQQQQGAAKASPVGSQASERQQSPPHTPMISQHASQLRQRDQQQQALYQQQYLNRSPSTPPEPQLLYGLQSASAVLVGSSSFNSSASAASGLAVSNSRQRPGSLVLSPSGMDGQGVGLPDLNVVRVFAGSNLQTEATFKTVLLNSSTTASDLVRQAIQRFRLPADEDAKEYYLEIKQMDGESAALLPGEKPLVVFESLVEAAMELPKVKRSSVGSISSIASNLSMHPAIKKLSMNDFTDDSAVKFYLHRKGPERSDGFMLDDGDDSMLVESPQSELSELTATKSRGQYLSASGGSMGVSAERFSAPSYRFAMQLVIYPDDLPDDMVFDPLTEAIVPKNTLRDRAQATSPGISQTMRKKVFVFPKNVTVAEVIELGLERFGISEGVVDGGDEIEDKYTKRRSSSRVRYGLAVDVSGKERELAPNSKVIDAFHRPPNLRAIERQGSNKRRSIDSAQLLLGSADDIQPDDPVFILRRAVAYRPSTSRHRLSAPLDEIALSHLHRDSVASSSVGSDSTAGPSEDAKSVTSSQTSKQAIIAAQRAASRANQRAILSAQANSARGLDVVLPGNAIIRSSRYEVGDRMRYSYVEPDGETTYDISDIVEEEWRNEVGARTNTNADDLLHGVLARGKDGLGAKLERVLSKIKHEKGSGRAPVSQTTSGSTTDSVSSIRSNSPSIYSLAENDRAATATPTAQTSTGRLTSASAHTERIASSTSRLSNYTTASSGTRSITPSAGQRRPPHGRNGSSLSDMSTYGTAPSSTPIPGHVHAATPVKNTRRLVLPKDDFNLQHMMSVIEARASQRKTPELPPQDPVDELLFGKQLDPSTLHPDIGDIYSSTLQQLDEMDEALDKLLHLAIPAF
ncbi:hypothetical protein WOLCODRAFT_137536 [Wolfiporia cocos MD-104 SS10]|uniref:SH3 domain-containing protein n=1 Tax=Wolfiporia cocos (strain MD-104) TaxID=742152 RepID=A0A2H3JSA1_WOLCO|nr:hypothetical protein WOLCODRAFT_137536 [Wolfiporia cocos MD-104 SS10]